MKLTLNEDVKVICELYRSMDAETRKAFKELAKTFCKDNAKEKINENKETGKAS